MSNGCVFYSLWAEDGKFFEYRTEEQGTRILEVGVLCSTFPYFHWPFVFPSSFINPCSSGLPFTVASCLLPYCLIAFVHSALLPPCSFVPLCLRGSKKPNHKNKTEKLVPAPKLALCVGCSPGLIRPSATFSKGEGKRKLICFGGG
jgi:hypothetical protein